MLTLRAAAGLLSSARDLASLAPLAAVAGIRGAPLPLDDAARAGLGLGSESADVAVARGDGGLRALLVEVAPGVPLRDALRRIACRLASRAPHLFWLLIAAEREGSGVGVATWSADRRPPRVAALQVQRDRVVPSDAETLRALAAAPDAVDALVHQRWLDVLGRDAVTRRFFRALESRVRDLADSGEGRADDATRRTIALLHVSRLLFLAFLQTKGWLDDDPGFLMNAFERSTGRGGWHRGLLDPLLFGTLNTPVRERAAAARAFGRVPFLNGGLFARTRLERRAALRFPDDALGRVLSELLCRYRFTAREDDGAWSEAAVDPEMLGRAFECLMAADDRKASGAFYTPQPLVEHVTALALREILVSRRIPDDVVASALHGEPVAPAWRATLAAHCEDLRLLDPACGSGAFLVHALERLSSLRARLGDARTTADLRRETLARSIFGVDVNPTAVWLCELRLWLSVVIESDESDPLRVPALPNLDRQVRTGDALLGGAFDAGDARAGRRVAALRARYARATGARKVALLRRLDGEERARAIDVLDRALARVRGERREIVLLGRARDLFGHRSGAGSRDTRRLRELRARGADLRRRRDALTDGGALPFLFGAHFADVAARGGFDVALGNPPWVRPHKLSAATRDALRREFRVARDAGWSGRDACGAGRGFASQTDLSALFVERSLSLLRPGGACALLLPAKLWRSLSGGGVRRLLSEQARVTCLEDWSDAPATFDAAVYPSILVARRETSPRGNALDGNHGSHPGLVVAIRDRGGERRWRTGAASLALDADAASPWLLAPPAARAAFDRLAAAGVALADSPIGRPLLGVKCGANDAFTVTVEALDGPTAIVSAGGAATRREGRVERCLLRPLLRGEDVRPWRAAPRAMLVWTHDADGHPLASLPRHATDWLAPWRARLVARSDARGRRRWWSLFRTDAAAHDRPRVVWCDVGRAPRAAVLDAGDDTVPLNSCYVARCPSLDDAHALAALLNGPLAAAWLALIAEPARGGYRRFLGWTMSLFPLPRDWARAVQLLAPLGRQGADGRAPSAAGLLDAALAAYALDHACVAPLLEDAPPPDD